MPAKLIEPTEVIPVNQLVTLVYGQPGSRKSSLAQTADNPFTLAFDPGIYRAYGRKGCAMFETWGDVVELGRDADQFAAGQAPKDPRYAALVKQFVEARTVVVDTIGMCLDKLSLAIIADSPKNGNRLGGLSLPGYGVLKSQFANWVNSIKSRGQDLVFIAHEADEKRGDETYYCPDIVGSSYNTVMNVADVVGYMHFENGKRVVSFNPTDRWMAKTPPCGFATMALPDFASEPDFLGRLMADAKASMGRISEQSARMAAVVAGWAQRLDASPSLDELNAMLPELGKLENGTKRQVWLLIQSRATEAGLVWDKAAKAFHLPAEGGAA
jgi:hypothetical protein